MRALFVAIARFLAGLFQQGTKKTNGYVTVPRSNLLPAASLQAPDLAPVSETSDDKRRHEVRRFRVYSLIRKGWATARGIFEHQPDVEYRRFKQLAPLPPSGCSWRDTFLVVVIPLRKACEMMQVREAGGLRCDDLVDSPQAILRDSDAYWLSLADVWRTKTLTAIEALSLLAQCPQLLPVGKRLPLSGTMDLTTGQPVCLERWIDGRLRLVAIEKKSRQLTTQRLEQLAA